MKRNKLLFSNFESWNLQQFKQLENWNMIHVVIVMDFFSTEAVIQRRYNKKSEQIFVTGAC